MNFGSRRIGRLSRPVEPAGYVCLAMFLPLAVVRVGEVWNSDHRLKLGFYVLAVLLLLGLWLGKTQRLFEELSSSRVWAVAGCLPMALLLRAESAKGRRFEGARLAIRLFIPIGLLIPSRGDIGQTHPARESANRPA